MRLVPMLMAVDSTGNNDPRATLRRKPAYYPVRSQHDRLFGVAKQIAAQQVYQITISLTKSNMAARTTAIDSVRPGLLP